MSPSAREGTTIQSDKTVQQIFAQNYIAGDAFIATNQAPMPKTLSVGVNKNGANQRPNASQTGRRHRRNNRRGRGRGGASALNAGHIDANQADDEIGIQSIEALTLQTDPAAESASDESHPIQYRGGQSRGRGGFMGTGRGHSHNGSATSYSYNATTNENDNCLPLAGALGYRGGSNRGRGGLRAPGHGNSHHNAPDTPIHDDHNVMTDATTSFNNQHWGGPSRGNSYNTHSNRNANGDGTIQDEVIFTIPTRGRGGYGTRGCVAQAGHITQIPPVGNPGSRGAEHGVVQGPHGHTHGRGGFQGRRQAIARVLPMAAADNVPFKTEIPAHEISSIVNVVREHLVAPRRLLQTYIGYRLNYGPRGLGSRRSDFPNGVIPSNIKGHFLPAVNPSDPKKDVRPLLVIDGELLTKWVDSSRTADEPYMGRIAVIDGITGERLIDNYCKPTLAEGPIKSYGQAYSGMSREHVDAATERGEVYRGLAQLVAAIGRYSDDSTILIGHAFWNDLFALKLNASHIADTQLMYAYLDPKQRAPGLKTCMSTVMQTDIQPTKQHSAYVDSWATRELLILKARDILAGGAAPVWSAHPRPRPKQQRYQSSRAGDDCDIYSDDDDS